MRSLILGLLFLSAACKFQQAKETEVVTPVSESSTPINDSTYLSVTVLDSAFELKVLNKAATVRDAAGVNDFITANKSVIDANKIMIHTGSNPFEKYKPVIEVMSKNGYSKFGMAKK
jgi:hypothetical protein